MGKGDGGWGPGKGGEPGTYTGTTTKYTGYLHLLQWGLLDPVKGGEVHTIGPPQQQQQKLTKAKFKRFACLSTHEKKIPSHKKEDYFLH
jgi:hypothetical protein